MSKLERNTLGLGAHPALLVVDASVAFTDPDSPLGGRFDAEIDTIIALMELARQQRWPRFLSTVWYESADEARVFREKLPDLDLLQAGSDQTAIDPRLPVDVSDVVIRKTHASFFFGTDLDARLRLNEIDSLVIAGFTTSGCVRATAVDGLQHDYRSIVIEDAVGDRDALAHAANLSDIDAKYGDVCTLAQLEEAL